MSGNINRLQVITSRCQVITCWCQVSSGSTKDIHYCMTQNRKMVPIQGSVRIQENSTDTEDGTNTWKSFSFDKQCR